MAGRILKSCEKGAGTPRTEPVLFHCLYCRSTHNCPISLFDVFDFLTKNTIFQGVFSENVDNEYNLFEITIKTTPSLFAYGRISTHNRPTVDNFRNYELFINFMKEYDYIYFIL